MADKSLLSAQAGDEMAEIEAKMRDELSRPEPQGEIAESAEEEEGEGGATAATGGNDITEEDIQWMLEELARPEEPYEEEHHSSVEVNFCMIFTLQSISAKDRADTA